MFDWAGTGAQGRRRIGRRRLANGQSVAEFALVLPVLVAILGGIIQFGVIFWAQNTLTQVVRDTGRWAATQQACGISAGSSGTAAAAVLGEAQLIAGSSSLIAYPPSSAWSVTPKSSDAAVATFNTEGVAVAWVQDYDPVTGIVVNGKSWTHEGCPPNDNQAVYHVTIKIVHTVPVFFPGMQYLPGFANNAITLSSTAQFRMEPTP